MKIETRDFGIMEIDENEIINFPKGVFAFDDATKFTLITKNDCSAMWLQCTLYGDLRFVVFDPNDIVYGYEPKLSQKELHELKADSIKDIKFLVIAVVPENLCEMTVNLKSPIAINMEKKIAVQIILDNAEYPIRYKVFDEEYA